MAVKTSDQITIVDLTDGYSVGLTADSFSLMGNTSGAVSTATTLSTTVQAYQGSTALTSSEVTIGTISSITGVTASVSGLVITLTVATTCTGGTITVPITIDDLEFIKTISISVAKTGGTGAAAYQYKLNADIGSIVRAEGGGLTPSSITFNATRAQGTDSPEAYSGRFKIEYYSGTSWTAAYTSSSNEASKAYALSSTTLASASFVRCTLYLAGGTTTVLDIVTVPIVSDGDTGGTGAAGKGVSSITGHYLATTASSGVTTSTSGWSTSIQTVTSTKKYLWYYETIAYVNPTSSVNTTPVIIGVYGDTGSQGPQGPQGDAGEDAILITIESDNGTVFKNSSGSTTLTARVFVGGVEKTISSGGVVADSLGSIYWYKDGTKVSSPSKTLAISASAVSTKMVISAQLES